MSEPLLTQLKTQIEQDDKLIKDTIIKLKQDMKEAVTVEVVKRTTNGSLEIAVIPKDDTDLLINFKKLFEIDDSEINTLKSRVEELSELGICEKFPIKDLSIGVNFADIEPTIESMLKIYLLLGRQINNDSLDKILYDIRMGIYHQLNEYKSNRRSSSDDAFRVFIMSNDYIGFSVFKFKLIDTSMNPLCSLFKRSRTDVKMVSELVIFKIKRKFLIDEILVIIKNILMDFRFAQIELNSIDRLILVETIRKKILEL